LSPCATKASTTRGLRPRWHGTSPYVLPSIELGDSLVQPSQKLTGPILTLYDLVSQAMLIGLPIVFDADRHPEVLRRWS
jgi:hypothetical protein